MAFTPFHNLRGATAQDNELVALNDTKKGIKSLQISNVKVDAAATVDLYLFKDSTDATASQTIYILNQIVIPFGVSLFLNEDEIHFDNNLYSLYMNVGSSDTVDVLIKKKQSK
tara:strand:- start:367 stop:705 length:339 start_codon:yes stop_codon:yes gene_type:complete